MRLKLIFCFLLLIPALAEADHACVDGYPMGKPLMLAQSLPSGWFRVGSDDIRKEATHSALKKRYRNEYYNDNDEGPVGSLCLKLKVGYVEVTTSDFGSGVQYSVLAPKCARCGSIRDTEKEFASGTGLRLGLTKAKRPNSSRQRLLLTLLM